MSENKPAAPVYLSRQVFSAMFVGAVAANSYGNAVSEMLARHYGVFRASSEHGALRLELPLILSTYAAAWWWTRPISRFLDSGEEGRRAVAQRRYRGLYRFLLAMLAGTWAVITAWDWWNNPSWPWTRALLPGFVGDYYGAYFTILFLEPLLIARVGGRLYGEPEIFARKSGPTWSVRAKLTLLVLNLILVPLLLLELARRTGAGASTSAWVIGTTFVFAAGYLEVLYRSIAKPLTGLVDKMRRVAAGDYAAKTIVLDDDEIGELKAYFNDMVDGLAERERLKDTFGRYVSVEVAKRLMESGAISLGGESIEAAVLFSDIRDFTPMSESMTPQDLVRFLNSYFSAVTPPISEHKGMINKFIGDAVMAVFAPQFGSHAHADDAVRAALGMRAALADFNAREGRAIRFGVGVHAGPLVAGNIGTEKRLEYTVIGDTVNVASRIESQNKEQGSVILISEEAYARLSPALKGALKAERRDAVKLKGKERPVALYSI